MKKQTIEAIHKIISGLEHEELQKVEQIQGLLKQLADQRVRHKNDVDALEIKICRLESDLDNCYHTARQALEVMKPDFDPERCTYLITQLRDLAQELFTAASQ